MQIGAGVPRAEKQIRARPVYPNIMYINCSYDIIKPPIHFAHPIQIYPTEKSSEVTDSP